MTEWISAKDRLPEEYGLYLICKEDGEVSCAYREDLIFFTCNNYIWNCDLTGGLCVIPDEEVTHWMPLPSPPNMEE